MLQIARRRMRLRWLVVALVPCVLVFGAGFRKMTHEVNSVTFEVRERTSIGPLVLYQSTRPSVLGARTAGDSDHGQWLLTDIRYWHSGARFHPEYGELEALIQGVAACWELTRADAIRQEHDISLVRNILKRHRHFIVELNDDGYVIREEGVFSAVEQTRSATRPRAQ